MKVFAISDLHLSTNCQKPMDIFGKSWVNYFELICADWKAKVSQDDVVLLPFSYNFHVDVIISFLSVPEALHGKFARASGQGRES